MKFPVYAKVIADIGLAIAGDGGRHCYKPGELIVVVSTDDGCWDYEGKRLDRTFTQSFYKEELEILPEQMQETLKTLYEK